MSEQSNIFDYVPLRVYSVYSRGKGAVAADELAAFLCPKKILALAVADPFSILGWESFYRQAGKKGMKLLPGLEIRIQGLGALVMFPSTRNGYFSLVASFNDKKLSRLTDVLAVFIPGQGQIVLPSAIASLKKNISPSNLFIGLEWHTRREIVKIAHDLHLQLVWAQPLRWLHQPEKYAVAASIFNHRPLSELLPRLEKDSDLYLYGPISGSAISKRWGETGRQAMQNTFALADRVAFDFSHIFPPDIPAPGKDASHPNERLEEIVNREIRERESGLAERERTFRELNIIKDMQFSPYFLVAAEIAVFCKKNRIYFNLRGSGVSSFILYLLGLSRINPLHYNLLFERFVNSLRDDLPDIDIDIDSSRRPEVLQWVLEKYRGRVAFVSTHKFFRARSALYEVARAGGLTPEEAHKMSKELPMFASPAELTGKGKGKLAPIYTRAALLEGVYKELSLHVGGVVFSSDPVEKSFPVEASPQGFSQTLWDKDTIERLRIFKLDLLGVRGFDVISPTALDRDFDSADAQVWENIQKGRTIGCFQLESPLARDNLQKVQPQNLHELAISIAIIRPGPAKSGMKQAYIERKAPLHPLLGKIFSHTRGAIIFEEQISVLLHTVTGWNLEQAEMVRRYLKKQKGEEYREEFFKKGKKNGWQSKELEEFWQIAVNFSLYAFNQAHSISYAYSAYISAWLKTRHPQTFFCRLFNSGGGYYPLPFYIEEAKKWDIRLLPPDINRSRIGFTEEDGAIRTGLIFVKGIGHKSAGGIVEQRGMGYASIEDFIARTRTGERDLSSLMAVSAFQSLVRENFSPAEKKKNWQDYLGFLPI